VRMALRAMEFYAHESCGWCTPCREGSGWLRKLFHRLEHGEGREEDLPLITSIGSQIAGHTFCAFGDSFNFPLQSVRLFEEDFRRHIAERRCPYGH
jgi:NADH-quinone oxidoreductase subunit F